MVDWFKEKNMTFQLKDMGVQEDFTIWKAWDKRSEVMKDGAGNEMQFPIRKGQLTTVKNEIKEFDDIKWMKKKDFEEAFMGEDGKPNLSRNTRYIRNILVGGIEYKYGFTKTGNDKVVDLINSVQALGQNPLTVNFQQTFDKSQSPANMYGMMIVAAPVVATAPPPGFVPPVEATQPIVPPVTQAPVPPKVEPVAPKVQHDFAKEKEVMEAIKSKFGDKKPDITRFVEIMKANSIKEVRAKELYKSLK